MEVSDEQHRRNHPPGRAGSRRKEICVRAKIVVAAAQWAGFTQPVDNETTDYQNMNQKILSALFCRAKRSGMRLKFRQIDSGDYEARWAVGARSAAWCGTLAEAWALAGGAR